MLEQGVRCLAVALAASIAFWLWDGSRFSWHPTLMAVGFLGLMSEGVLASLRLRGIDAGPERVRGIQRHALIQAAALACAAGGLYAIYTNKVRLGKLHFRTLHARAGLAALLLGVAAPLGGVLAFKSLGLLDGRSETLQQRVKWAHRKLGLATWLCALGAVELALTHPAVYRGLVNRAWQLAVAGAAAAVLALASRAAKRRALLPTQAELFGVVSAADELKAL